MLQKKLKVQVFENAILLPPKKDKSKSWGLGGVVDENNKFIEDSVYRFYFGGNYNFDKSQILESDEEVIYLGHLIPHWGVFLVDFTRRLWYYYKCQNKSVKLAFFGVNMPSVGFESMEQMYNDFFRLADIDEACIIDVKEIIRFKKVYVPEMGYDEDRAYYSIDYLIPFNQIVNNLSEHIKKKQVGYKTYSKVYLSRTRFASFREAGENLIEQFFALNGFKIIYPETLTFIQKTVVFKDAEVIASIEGTTAHSILFATKAKSQIIIKKQKLENSRQPWFNEMKHVPSTTLDVYYEPIPRLPYSWDEGPFLMLFNGNMKKFAKANGMILPRGILFANLNSILHYLHIALILYLQKHDFIHKAIKPLFVIVRKIKKIRKKGKLNS